MVNVITINANPIVKIVTHFGGELVLMVEYICSQSLWDGERRFIENSIRIF
tara:strand:+ start:7127 stop:7279 length:153 start_codon:yes stop_codon:yes gene_type:complete